MTASEMAKFLGRIGTLTINGTVYRITDLQPQDDGALLLLILVKV